MHSTKLLTWCLASLSLVLATPDLPNKEILKRQTACSSSSPAPTSIPGPVLSSQNVTAPSFVGSPAEAHHLEPKIRFLPDASLLHQDGGNTNSLDYPGPLGITPAVSSAAVEIGVLLWGQDGSLSSGYVSIANATLKEGLATLDPTTFQVLATWFPPDANQVLQYAYMELDFQGNSIVVPSKQGHIYVVSRGECNGTSSLTLMRNIDLTSTISAGEQLLNSLLDAEGNIWFTTGGIIGSGDPVQATCTIGYVSPNGTVRARHFQDQMVENGIDVNGTTMWAVTGPSGAAFNQTNATGYIYSFTTGASLEPTTLWSEPYSAGSQLKPGGFARGSGSTPALLGNQYVAITDNSDEQINLIVYNLDLSGTAANKTRVHCSVPLFQKGASGNEIGLTVHQNGSVWGISILNAWRYPAQWTFGEDVNGGFNNMTGMAPGISRIDVHPDGCRTRWELDLRIKSVPVLSTETGLYYGYVQDEDLAVEGLYAWYVVAIDWDSGNEVWRAKTGAGGSFNDNFYPGTLGPDGAFYQGIIGGYVRMMDGESVTL